VVPVTFETFASAMFEMVKGGCCAYLGEDRCRASIAFEDDEPIVVIGGRNIIRTTHTFVVVSDNGDDGGAPTITVTAVYCQSHDPRTGNVTADADPALLKRLAEKWPEP
jgi:hypothetical protein